MSLSEEKLNRNYILWIECLKKYNCYSEELIDEYGERIKNSSFALTKSSGGAYQGSLLDVVLSNLCVIATHINECAFGMNDKQKLKHQYLNVNKESLMKVLLLQHISKCELFTPSTEQWKVGKGILYEFNQDLPTSLKYGDRSVYICQKCGIKFTEEEYDAMKVCDKDEDKTNSFVTPLAEIVKISNQLTAIEIYQKEKNSK